MTDQEYDEPGEAVNEVTPTNTPEPVIDFPEEEREDRAQGATGQESRRPVNGEEQGQQPDQETLG